MNRQCPILATLALGVLLLAGCGDTPAPPPGPSGDQAANPPALPTTDTVAATVGVADYPDPAKLPDQPYPTVSSEMKARFQELYSDYRDRAQSDSPVNEASINAAPNNAAETAIELSLALQYRQRHDQRVDEGDMTALVTLLRLAQTADEAEAAMAYESTADAFTHVFHRYVDAVALYRAAAETGLASENVYRKMGYTLILMGENPQLVQAFQPEDVQLIAPGAASPTDAERAAISAMGRHLYGGYAYDDFRGAKADDPVVQALYQRIDDRVKILRTGHLRDSHVRPDTAAAQAQQEAGQD